MNLAWLNVIGLILVTVAAVLMCFLPPRITRHTPVGEPRMDWVKTLPRPASFWGRSKPAYRCLAPSSSRSASSSS